MNLNSNEKRSKLFRPFYISIRPGPFFEGPGYWIVVAFVFALLCISCGVSCKSVRLVKAYRSGLPYYDTITVEKIWRAPLTRVYHYQYKPALKPIEDHETN